MKDIDMEDMDMEDMEDMDMEDTGSIAVSLIGNMIGIRLAKLGDAISNMKLSLTDSLTH